VPNFQDLISKDIASFSSLLSKSEKETVTDENAMMAMYFLDSLRLAKTTSDLFLLCSSLNLLYSYSKQPGSFHGNKKNGSYYKQYILKVLSLSPAIYQDVNVATFLDEEKQYSVCISFFGFSFLFHNIGNGLCVKRFFQNNYHLVQNDSKARIAQTLFLAALNYLDNSENGTESGLSEAHKQFVLLYSQKKISLQTHWYLIDKSKKAELMAATFSKEGLLRRSMVKSHGIKSMFYGNHSLLLTALPNSSDNSSYFLFSDQGKPLSNLESAPFESVLVKPKTIFVNYLDGERSSSIRNPAYSATDFGPGGDRLGLKPFLENAIFGATVDDNVHIQICYNIISIQKELTIQINNVFSLINNLNRNSSAELPLAEENSSSTLDFIGTFFYQDTYFSELEKAKSTPRAKRQIDNASQVVNCARHYNQYLSNIFCFSSSDYSRFWPSQSALPTPEEYNYNLIRLLSFSRQFLVHSSLAATDSEQKSLNISKNLREQAPDLFSFLTDFVSSKAASLNSFFVENSAKNLFLLGLLDGSVSIQNSLLLVDEEAFKRLCIDYYSFSILKDGKNLGLDLKKVRRYLMSFYARDLFDKNYQSGASKTNLLVDFLVFRICKANNGVVLPFVDMLLSAKSCGNSKEEIYRRLAQRIYEEGKTVFDRLFYQIKSGFFSTNRDKLSSQLKKYIILPTISLEQDGFSSYLFFVSLFLSGKERNVFFNTICHSLDSTKELLNASKILYASNPQTEPCFKDEYALFDAQHITSLISSCKRLYRVSASFAKPNSKNLIFDDAVLSDAFNLFRRDHFLSFDPYGSKAEEQNGPRAGNPSQLLFNFMKANVINSTYFSFLCRYFDPRYVRRLMDEKNVVIFALKDMEGKHRGVLAKYCPELSQENGKSSSVDEMAIKLFQKMEFLDFDKVYADPINRASRQFSSSISEQKKMIKQTNPSILNLYLRIAYGIVKHFVAINSLYLNAFACYERDASLLTGVADPPVDASLVKDALAKRRYNKKVCYLLNEYLLDYESYQKKIPANNGFDLFRLYRNGIVHLNFIKLLITYNDISKMDSFFDLYSYVVERSLIDIAKSRGVAAFDSVYKMIKTKATPSRDLLKLINLPFAYCYPRFANLTNSVLFNSFFGNNVSSSGSIKKQKIQDRASGFMGVTKETPNVLK
jgi:hypothetical protein